MQQLLNSELGISKHFCAFWNTIPLRCKKCKSSLTIALESLFLDWWSCIWVAIPIHVSSRCRINGLFVCSVELSMSSLVFQSGNSFPILQYQPKLYCEQHDTKSSHLTKKYLRRRNLPKYLPDFNHKRWLFDYHCRFLLLYSLKYHKKRTDYQVYLKIRNVFVIY